MPEHYTRNTLECTAWCAKCQDYTQHRVDGGRRGPCLINHPQSKSQTKKQRGKELKQLREQQNPKLF